MVDDPPVANVRAIHLENVLTAPNGGDGCVKFMSVDNVHAIEFYTTHARRASFGQRRTPSPLSMSDTFSK